MGLQAKPCIFPPMNKMSGVHEIEPVFQLTAFRLIIVPVLDSHRQTCGASGWKWSEGTGCSPPRPSGSLSHFVGTASPPSDWSSRCSLEDRGVGAHLQGNSKHAVNRCSTDTEKWGWKWCHIIFLMLKQTFFIRKVSLLPALTTFCLQICQHDVCTPRSGATSGPDVSDVQM